MKTLNDASRSAEVEVDRSSARTVRLHLSGTLTTPEVSPLYRQIQKALAKKPPQNLQIDLSKLENCDTAGAAMLFTVKQNAENRQIRTEFTHMPDSVRRYFDLMSRSGSADPKFAHTINPETALAHLGKVTVDSVIDIKEQIGFLGHLCASLSYCLARPSKIRYRDFWRTCEQAGADAAPIVAMLGLLFGLILAFSSAMPLQQFGVEIYVADFVSFALVRVLGPFVTAIILAGRTGSAFAAEVGTMKINNEIDALEVMALDPVRFLVVPRFLAAVLMAPLLTVLTILSGIVGAGIVILSLGYPMVTYISHVKNMIEPSDIGVGLTKAVVFGGLVAAIGTLRGLQTGLGPGAVGISTTRAVVTSIIAIVITEGIFSVVLYYTGI